MRQVGGSLSFHSWQKTHWGGGVDQQVSALFEIGYLLTTLSLATVLLDSQKAALKLAFNVCNPFTPNRRALAFLSIDLLADPPADLMRTPMD